LKLSAHARARAHTHTHTHRHRGSFQSILWEQENTSWLC